MDINERIEKLKQRNDFFYDEDIALCIKSLEALQEIKKIININNSYTQKDVIVMKYKVICNFVDTALEEITGNSEEMGKCVDGVKKIGYWIYNPKTDLATCSNCGASCPSDKYGRIEVDYCPNCNSFMKIMREATKEESDSINNYIKSISTEVQRLDETNMDI